MFDKKKCDNCGEVHGKKGKKHDAKELIKVVSESLEVVGYKMPIVVIKGHGELCALVNCNGTVMVEIFEKLFAHEELREIAKDVLHDMDCEGNPMSSL